MLGTPQKFSPLLTAQGAPRTCSPAWPLSAAFKPGPHRQLHQDSGQPTAGRCPGTHRQKERARVTHQAQEVDMGQGAPTCPTQPWRPGKRGSAQGRLGGRTALCPDKAKALERSAVWAAGCAHLKRSGQLTKSSVLRLSGQLWPTWAAASLPCACSGAPFLPEGAVVTAPCHRGGSTWPTWTGHRGKHLATMLSRRSSQHTHPTHSPAEAVCEGPQGQR